MAKRETKKSTTSAPATVVNVDNTETTQILKDIFKVLQEQQAEGKKKSQEKDPKKQTDITRSRRQKIDDKADSLLEKRKQLLKDIEQEEAKGANANQARIAKKSKQLKGINDELKKMKDEGVETILSKLFPESMADGKKFKSFLGDLSGSMRKMSASLSLAGGRMGKFGQALGKGAAGIDKFIQGMGPVGFLLIGIGIQAAKFALQLDNLSKKIGSATGFGDQFNQSLMTGYQETMASGVSMEEYTNSVIALSSAYSAFDPSNKKMIKSLANTSARLEKLGVSAQTSAKMMDHFTRAQGMSAQQAADTTAQIALMGKAIGVTASKMAQDFESASGRLAIYGDKNIKVFKQLTAQAKATGMEVSTLLAISQKFDTFDSAAGSIGQLNAVLGTNLSTIEMLNANDAERVQMMKDQIKMSVGNFDSLDKHTKMYIAQAMGVKDVAEAQRLLNMTNAEAAKYQKAQQEQADIQKELADRTAELVPFLDKLKIAGMQIFLTLKPLISGFTAIIWAISSVIGWISSLFKPMEELGFWGNLIKGVLIAVGLAWIAATWPITGTVAAIMAVIGALGLLWDWWHADGSPELWEMPLHVGEGFSIMTDAVANAAKKIMNFVSNPLGSLWDAFHWSGSPALWEMPGAFADQIVRIADAITETITAVTGFAETLIKMASIDYKGFVAIRTDGGSTSMIMGSEDVVTSLNKGKLTVDVKMPEIKLPEVQVKVYIGNRELKEIIKTEVSSIIGKGG